MQHLDLQPYLRWKTEKINIAMTRRGFDISKINVRPIVHIPAGTRRRAVFSFSIKQGNKIDFGFNERGSNKITNLESCLLLYPELNNIIVPLRNLISSIARPSVPTKKMFKKKRPVKLAGSVIVSMTDSGLDVVIEMPQELDLVAREEIAAFAGKHSLSRISWSVSDSRFSGFKSEPVAELLPPYVSFSGTKVAFPAGSFLQPSIEGEQAIARLIMKAIGGLSSVVDLYCGLGSFSFPMAKNGIKVHAIDGDENLINGLISAAGKVGLSSKLTAEKRNLNKEPFETSELDNFEAVVFDPPRAGASSQAKQIAQTENLKTVVAVSCNPSTFARDARTLTDSGFVIEEITPVDQFPFSHHLELVAVFRK